MDLFPQSLLSAIQPGSYSVLDTTALSGNRAPSGRRVAIVGAALGGQPNVPLTIFGAADLRTTLRGGVAYDLARVAFQAGAQPITVVRGGTGITQASIVLAGTGGTALTLTSLGWGAFANAINVAATATTVTITFTDALNGVSYKETYTVDAALAGNAAILNLAAQINGTVPGVSKSALVSGVGGAATALTVAAAAPMSGGADGAVMNAGDWTTALTALETTDVWQIVPGTEDATIHAQVAAHVLAMSAPLARHERRAVYGGSAGETVDQAVTRANTAGIRTRRAQLVYPGVTLFDAQGRATALSPMYAAAYIAGRRAALPDAATSLMHAQLDGVLDVERELSTIQGGDLDKLLRAGVSPIGRAPGGGFWLVDDLSLEPADPTFRDFPVMGSLDTAARRLRTATEGKFTGKKALGATTGAIALEAIAELDALKGQQIIRDYNADQVVVTEDPSTPGRFTLVAPVMPVFTTRFVGIVLAVQLPTRPANA